MAEHEESPQACDTPPRFLEVLCKSSGKTRRFAPGVKAGFALSLINQKLDSDAPLPMYIEAAKEGEESVIFGPCSLLVNCGVGWKLQTVVLSEGTYGTTREPSGGQGMNSFGSTGKVSPSVISYRYIGRILLAFVLIFLLAGIFTFALENLPRLILLFNSPLPN